MQFRTKEDYVADFLREAIISGQYERGRRLKQAEIAALLGLSITPVREALKLLEAEGYVKRESHHGVMVSPFDLTTSEDITGLRTLLEERLVRGAVEHMGKADLSELVALQEQFEQSIAAGDRTRARGTNYRFHLHLYSLARQPQTLHFVQILWAKYPFDIINTVGGRMQRAAQEHRAILKHLIARDADKAAQAVRRHIEQGWTELRQHLASEPVR